MSSTPWDGFIPEETLELYRRAGFAKPTRTGTKAALLVIDTQYLTTGEGPTPLAEAINYHPLNCGEYAWKAIPHMMRLIAAFRAERMPIIYAYYPPPKGRPSRGHQVRLPAAAVNARHFEFVEQIAPQEGDILLPKVAPSAFFGTPLVKYLNMLKVDTLFVIGNTTSGCIRAAVVDGVSYDYKMVVAYEGCYDRAPVCHAVNLFDMASKYADVLTTTEAIAMLDALTVTEVPAEVAP